MLPFFFNAKNIKVYLFTIFENCFLFSKAKRISKTRKTCLVFSFFCTAKIYMSTKKQEFSGNIKSCHLCFSKLFLGTVYKKQE